MMAAMATVLPLYGVMCLVALVTAAVLMMSGKGREGVRRGRSSAEALHVNS